MIDPDSALQVFAHVAGRVIEKLREQIASRDLDGARETADFLIGMVKTMQELAELPE